MALFNNKEMDELKIQIAGLNREKYGFEEVVKSLKQKSIEDNKLIVSLEQALTENNNKTIVLENELVHQKLINKTQFDEFWLESGSLSTKYTDDLSMDVSDEQLAFMRKQNRLTNAFTELIKTIKSNPFKMTRI